MMVAAVPLTRAAPNLLRVQGIQGKERGSHGWVHVGMYCFAVHLTGYLGLLTQDKG